MSFVKTRFALPSVTDRNGRVAELAYVPGQACPARGPGQIKTAVATRRKTFVSNMQRVTPRARLFAVPAGKSLGAIVAKRNFAVRSYLHGLGDCTFDSDCGPNGVCGAGVCFSNSGPPPVAAGSGGASSPSPTGGGGKAGGSSSPNTTNTVINAIASVAGALAKAFTPSGAAAQKAPVAQPPAGGSGISSNVGGLPLWGWGLIGVTGLGMVAAVARGR